MIQTKSFACFVFASCLLIALIAPSAAVFGQTSWTSAGGTFKLDAEFVQLKDGRVQLKKSANDELVWVDMDQLSEKAQKQARRFHSEAQAAHREAKKAAKAAAEAAAIAAAKAEAEETQTPRMLGRPIVSAQAPRRAMDLAKNEPVPNYGSATKQPTNTMPAKTMPTKSAVGEGLTAYADVRKAQFGGDRGWTQVVVAINMTGDAAAEALKYGKIELTEFVDEAGRPIEPEKSRVGVADITKSYLRVYRDLTSTKTNLVHPKDGLLVDVRVPANTKPLEIRRLVGKFSIITGGERITDSVDNLNGILGQAVESEMLKGLGVKAEMGEKIEKHTSKLSRTPIDFFDLTFTLTGNYKSLDRVWIGDAERQQLEGLDGEGDTGVVDGKQTWRFTFTDESAIEKAVLYFESNDGESEMEVPFEFSDLKVVGHPKKRGRR